MVGLALVLLLLLAELLLEALPPLLPLPGVVDEGLVLPPTLLSVLLLPPSVLPAFWFDGITEGTGVLLPPSLLLLSGVVVGGAGVLLLLLPSSPLLSVVSLSDVVGGGGILPILSTLLALAPVISSLGFELLLPPSMLLSPAAIDGVDVPSDLCLFFVLLLLSESVVGGIDKEANVLLLLLPCVLLLSLVEGLGGTASVVVFLSSDLCLFFIESSEGIIVGGGRHFPFTGIEPSGHGTDKEANVLLLLPLRPSPLLLSSAPSNGVDVSPPPVFVVGLPSDLLFFAAKTV